MNLEYVEIPHLGEKVCRIGIGTWAIGGWLWGGTDEKNAIAAIHRALDLGINLIDTAPIYGFGVSEEIVGKALKNHRKKAIIATKAGLNWENLPPKRDSRKSSIKREIEDSLRRLQIERIDLYQIHWPDFETPFSETAEAISELLKEGKIGAIGVSNYTPAMIDEFRKFAPVHTLQSPYNLFEPGLEIAYCKKQGIVSLGYGPLCRGLLTGRITPETHFEGDDLRKQDPKFQEPRFSQYLDCTRKLTSWVHHKYQKTLLLLALRWVLDEGVDIALWGVRRPDHLAVFEQVWDWKLTESDKREIDRIISETIVDPVGTEFMVPPVASSTA